MTKYELYFQVSQLHLAEQTARNRQLETKAGAAFGLGATLIGLAGLTVAHWSYWSIYPAGFLLTSFLFVAFFSLPVAPGQRLPAVSPSV